MQIGDLVFVKGTAEYRFTIPGSWGYILGEATIGKDRKRVRFRYYPHRGGTYTDPSRKDEEETWAIRTKDLIVLPEPPATPEEITALVEALTRLTK